MLAEKKWVLKEQADPAATASLAAGLGIPPILAGLLVQRGIATKEEAQRFFKPDFANLHDPFLMKDMQKAVERIETALAENQKIMVYGDYDVDGTTAVALIYSFLARLGHQNLSFYIPDRYGEGYGISIKGIDHAAAGGVKLIIALDCGIKAVEKAEYAKAKGIDLIICDHHLPGDTIPDAVAVLDPKRADCEYPFKELSGCGVGFKLAQAYAQFRNLPFSEVERLLDLVAVSIAADIVPLVGENRILAYYGLKRLNDKPNKGLSSILKICGLQNHAVTIDDIVFKIGPRINAAGRMATEEDADGNIRSGGHMAVRLLTASTEERADKYGGTIDDRNTDRKSIDRSITQQAHDYIERNPHLKELKSTVIYNPEWMKGVVGIVASRLIETYYKPTVVLTMSNGLVTGSARSVPGFDLYQAVESCSDLLENFGGHTYAAGLTMKPDKVEEFTRRFQEYVEKNISPQMLVPQIDIDLEVPLAEITPSFRRVLGTFQPFGPGNPAPVFATRKAVDNGSARLVGADTDHLKMELLQSEKPYSTIAAIAFGQPHHFEHVAGGGTVDICYCVVENHYRGAVTPQLRIKDIKIPHNGKS